MSQVEIHRSHRSGWLRAAVLGANDGIVSTASLIIGVAAAQPAHAEIILAGVAGLVAGAMSMAAGEYVSVSSQSDAEMADLDLERQSLNDNYADELKELAHIYEARGLDSNLAHAVAKQLMAHDALGAHAKDELGLVDRVRARPIQAALFSASTFTIGAALPLFVAWNIPGSLLIPSVAISSLVFLATLGALAARAGGAEMSKGAIRVTFWGALAMSLTAAVGGWLGVVV
ncbi:VIT family protein [Nitrosomonas sp. JL21]|uniref:VIT1/CCC1 transporter family protein n=1 Tax=Nitrosomonas sp. JL21 TaxID=153949 RepID=UPI0013707977|nr:VIT family protein [Nitrosomonas sp. JL21]MBL8498098.1 VIT family protein [Nitrosomonas sp.]MXS76388.1 VIT family protein [Nitrosomonas sp. JL21]